MELGEYLSAIEESHATARHNTLLDGGACRMHGVVDPVLAFLHLNLRSAADANDRNATSQFGQPLLQFLTVVVGRCLLDLGPDLCNTTLDLLFLAGTVDNCGVFLVDADLFGLAEHVQRDIFELDAEIFADYLTAGQRRYVLEHRLAAVA